MLNLILNAADAMKDIYDRPRNLLLATAREAVDRVRLSVRDSGIGLDPRTVDRPVRGVLHDQDARDGRGPLDQPLHHREPRRTALGRGERRARSDLLVLRSLPHATAVASISMTMSGWNSAATPSSVPGGFAPPRRARRLRGGLQKPRHVGHVVVEPHDIRERHARPARGTVSRLSSACASCFAMSRACSGLPFASTEVWPAQKSVRPPSAHLDCLRIPECVLPGPGD